MKIMKFGGTSVKDASRIRDVTAVLSRENLSEGLVVVCSAMKGITDDLIKAARHAEDGNPDFAKILTGIWERQEMALGSLFAKSDAGNIRVKLEVLFQEMQEICHGIMLIRECTKRSLDLMMSFGERLNNNLIAAYLESTGILAKFVDARQLVVTDGNFGNGMVDFNQSYANITKYFQEMWGDSRAGKVAVVTGFIGATPEGITTTLGRNGSDYTAAIFGAALSASDIEIWTDVDGVLSADPRIVSKAFVIPELSVEEAMEMCYFGAEVLHPFTIIPAVEKRIPIWIKNTMNPAARGSRIAIDAKPTSSTITGLASIQEVGLINIQGGGMMGTKGMASRIFLALAKADVNVIMISQASSEHSICIVLRSNECQEALKALHQELHSPMQAKLISSIDLVKDLEVVAVIGGNMRGRPGVSGKLFGALGSASINVLVIAQGSSEMNISFVIHKKDHVQALNVLHAAFFPEV